MNAAQAFNDTYGHRPLGVWRAPGRVNLMGEHTDYNNGLALPIAVEWGVDAALDFTRDGVVHARSARFPDQPVRFRPADLDPQHPLPGWGAYVAGAVWALREAGHWNRNDLGLRLYLDSDLPTGASLSSSAAVECALLLGLAQGAGLDAASDLTRPLLAQLAQRAENDYVGAPTGILDQSASLRSRQGRALLLDCQSLECERVPVDLTGGIGLLVIDTGVAHRLAEGGGGYAQRRRECERAAAGLGVDSLRQAGEPNAGKALGREVLERRVRHVVSENERVRAVARLLRGGDLAGVGPVFTASHASLRDDYEVSCAELDVAVQAAVAAGALGARMTGGGFGGSAIALVEARDVERVRAGVVRAFAREGFAAPVCRRVWAARGARRVL